MDNREMGSPDTEQELMAQVAGMLTRVMGQFDAIELQGCLIGVKADGGLYVCGAIADGASVPLSILAKMRDAMKALSKDGALSLDADGTALVLRVHGTDTYLLGVIFGDVSPDASIN